MANPQQAAIIEEGDAPLGGAIEVKVDGAEGPAEITETGGVVAPPVQPFASATVGGDVADQLSTAVAGAVKVLPRWVSFTSKSDFDGLSVKEEHDMDIDVALQWASREGRTAEEVERMRTRVRELGWADPWPHLAVDAKGDDVIADAQERCLGMSAEQMDLAQRWQWDRDERKRQAKERATADGARVLPVASRPIPAGGQGEEKSGTIVSPETRGRREAEGRGERKRPGRRATSDTWPRKLKSEDEVGGGIDETVLRGDPIAEDGGAAAADGVEMEADATVGGLSEAKRGQSEVVEGPMMRPPVAVRPFAGPTEARQADGRI
jgi:hypothetical protein